MDQEKLIKCVKPWEALYVSGHSRYNDTAFKDNAWRAIAKEINQSATACKKTWSSLRDSYRRAFKRKRETRGGQAGSKVKKWKFEDEMSFLLPYMQERDAAINVTELSDEPNVDEQNTEECNDNNDDREDDRNDNRSDNKDDDNNDDVDNNETNADNEKTERRTKMNRNIVIKVRRNKATRYQAQSTTASAMVMKYLLEKKTADATTTPTKKHSAIESFFSSIATTVENFSPYYQNIAKSKIFAIVTDLEMQQIRQQQFLMLKAPIQRPCSAPMTRIPLQSRQLYQTGQIDVYPSPVSPPVLTMTTPSHSPSTGAAPTPPPLCHGLQEANQMAHEDVSYNECMKIEIG